MDQRRKNENKPKYGLKNFLRVADSYVNPKVDNYEGIIKSLTSWYCFQFNVSLKDPVLQEHTLEELLVLYQMHRIKNDPNILNEELNPEVKDFESWLKDEMGEDYVTDEEMVEGVVEYDIEYTKRIRDQFPDKITTDFTKIGEE